MPTISVIIPAYNAEKTIAPTIQSVLNQTYSDFELLVINDGSTDSTLDVIEQFSDDRIQVFSYSNAGHCQNRNRGIELAKGAYIAFIDADDLWTSTKLEDQFNALQANPVAGLAYSWTDYIDSNGNPLFPGCHASWSGDVYPHLLVHHFLENGSNALIRRRVLTTIGGFDESLKAAPDWDLHLRIAAKYPFAVVRSPQILYRQSSQSVSANVIRQEQECLKVISRAFEQAPPALQSLKPKSLSNLYQYLTFKAIADSPSRSQARLGFRFLSTALHHEPALLKRRSRLMAIVTAKLLLSLLSPALMASFRRWN